MNKKHMEMKKQAVYDIVERLEYFDGYYCDLHNDVFNTDWYAIGTYQAKEELREYDVFEAIELVQEYEKFNFGEVMTELSNPEKLINMVYYIIGYEVIGEMYEIDEFNDNWNEEATEEINSVIIKAMKEMYNIE